MSMDLEAQYVSALDQLREQPDDPALEARVSRMEADLALDSAQDRLTAARSGGNPVAISKANEAFDEAEMAYLIALDVEAKSVTQDPQPEHSSYGQRLS